MWMHRSATSRGHALHAGSHILAYQGQEPGKCSGTNTCKGVASQLKVPSLDGAPTSHILPQGPSWALWDPQGP